MVNPRNDCLDDTLVGFAGMAAISTSLGTKTNYQKRRWREVKQGYTHFADGDVLLAKVTPCFENGKATVAQELPSGFGAGTTELHVFRAFGGYIEAGHMHALFRSSRFISAGMASMTGVAALNVSQQPSYKATH